MRQVVELADLIVHIAVALGIASKGGEHGVLVVDTVKGERLKRRRAGAGWAMVALGVFHDSILWSVARYWRLCRVHESRISSVAYRTKVWYVNRINE